MPNMDKIYVLVDLACARQNLANGMKTARACGDSKWAWDNLPSYDFYCEQIEKLKKELTAREIDLASEITNAAI